MTTFVLHGGPTSTDCPENEWFFRQFTSLVEKNLVKILMCYWARPDRTQELYERDCTKIKRLTTKAVEMTVVENPEDLFRLLPSYDVLYVAGGDAAPIEVFLPQMKNLKAALDGKVYIGASMGAFIVSRHYVLSFDDQDNRSVHTGLDVLPIMTLCHWDKEDQKEMKLAMLKHTNPDIPILALEETKPAILFV